MYHRSWRTTHKTNKSSGFKNWPILNLFFKGPRRRLILRDYQAKTFVNPFYSQISKPRRTRWKKLKLTLSFIILAVTTGILLLQPFFYISQINITGNNKISRQSLEALINQELEKKKLFFLNNRNYWLTDIQQISKVVEENYSLNSLRVDKKFPHNLNLTLSEKEGALIYKVAQKQWLLDDQGKVIQEAGAGDSTKSLPILYFDSASTTPKINASLVSPATIKFLGYLQEKIPEAAKIAIDYGRIIDAEGRVVHLQTKEGWQIYLDRQNDWDKQINVLTTILNNKLKNGRDKIRYIDVRYENRAYFQ